MLKRLVRGFKQLNKKEGILPWMLPFFGLMFSGIGFVLIYLTRYANVPRISSLIVGTVGVAMGIGFFALLVALCWKHGKE